MVSAVNPFSALNNLGASSADGTSFGDDFNTFLSLLTTQLQNQNPLEPLDTNQFTQQLVQFTGVEQQIKINGNLEGLLQLQAASAVNGAASYIGKFVDIEGAESQFNGTEAKWGISSTGEGQAIFTIKDSAGNIVFQDSKSILAGSGNYEWDGRLTNGGSAPAGVYSLSIEASNSSGAPLTSTVSTRGEVSSIKLDNGVPSLIVNGREISLDKILAISTQ